MPAKRKPGRPPRAARASTERLELRLSAAELRAWRKAAGGNPSLSEWVREICNTASGFWRMSETKR